MRCLDEMVPLVIAEKATCRFRYYCMLASAVKSCHLLSLLLARWTSPKSKPRARLVSNQAPRLRVCLRTGFGVAFSLSPSGDPRRGGLHTKLPVGLASVLLFILGRHIVIEHCL